MNVKRLALIGSGKLGSALICGFLASGELAPRAVMAADASKARLAFVRRYGIRTTTDDCEAAAWGHVIILAVKPHDLETMLHEIRPVLSSRSLLISVIAGATFAWIRRHVGRRPHLIRALPNLAAAVRSAITVLAPERATPIADLRIATRLFRTVGRVAVVQERFLDAAAGLSGSGPAYISMVVEALADGGVKMGLPRATARLLAAQTALGTARLLLESGVLPEQLIRQVATPGGTTAAGLRVLDQGRVRAHLARAVVAAARRAKQLGARRSSRR